MFNLRRDHIIRFATERAKFFYAQEEISDLQFHHYECFINTRNSMSVKSLNRQLPINHSYGVRSEDLEREVEYVRKLDTRVENGDIITIGTVPPKLPFFKDVYKQLLQFESTEEALQYLKNHDPRTYVLKRPAIESCLSREHRKRISTNYTKFNISFIDVNDGKAHVFVGDTGIGKTNFALAHFEKPVLISERQDFANIVADTDGIIMDDFTFKSWLATTVLHIVDVAMDRSINIKYGTATIPALLPWIITCNDLLLFWPQEHALKKYI